jgi:ABC-type dipeptide/oligopeptide/nickel transport system permease component
MRYLGLFTVVFAVIQVGFVIARFLNYCSLLIMSSPSIILIVLLVLLILIAKFTHKRKQAKRYAQTKRDYKISNKIRGNEL